MAPTPPRNVDTATDGVSDFAELGLPEGLCANLRRAGYDRPTPIQSQAIPPVLDGRDVLGCAQTGTGKTAAFALPILDRLHRTQSGPRREIRSLILAPTRELASQIADSITRYSAGSGLRAGVVFGGVGKLPQVRMLRGGVDILVACPGRLLDLLQEGALRLSNVEVLVLDEADRLLDMGFIRDVRRIASMTPRSRQTLLFSATMPTEIRRLADELLRDPAHVAVDPISSTREPISQSVYFVSKPGKADLLLSLLEDDEMERTLVFTRTKHGADKVVRRLGRSGVRAAAIHGNKSQPVRERALREFKSGKVRVVVATDIAARGIDVKGVTHVVNYDLPMDPESYVHRVGRTGRAGASGVALSFCSEEEQERLTAIERLTRRQLEPMGRAWPSATSTPRPRQPERPSRGNGRPRPESGRPRRRRGGRPGGTARS